MHIAASVGYFIRIYYDARNHKHKTMQWHLVGFSSLRICYFRFKFFLCREGGGRIYFVIFAPTTLIRTVFCGIQNVGSRLGNLRIVVPFKLTQTSSEAAQLLRRAFLQESIVPFVKLTSHLHSMPRARRIKIYLLPSYASVQYKMTYLILWFISKFFKDFCNKKVHIIIFNFYWMCSELCLHNSYIKSYTHGSVHRNSVLIRSNKMQQHAGIYLL